MTNTDQAVDYIAFEYHLHRLHFSLSCWIGMLLDNKGTHSDGAEFHGQCFSGYYLADLNQYFDCQCDHHGPPEGSFF